MGQGRGTIVWQHRTEWAINAHFTNTNSWHYHRLHHRHLTAESIWLFLRRTWHLWFQVCRSEDTQMVLAYLQRTFPATQLQEEEARKWHLEESCLRCKGSAAYNIVEAVVEEEQQWQDVHMGSQLLGPEQVDRRKGFLIADHLKPHFVAPCTHHFCPRIFFPCLRPMNPIQSSPIQSWVSKPSHEHLCHSNSSLLQFAPELNNRTQRLPHKSEESQPRLHKRI